MGNGASQKLSVHENDDYDDYDERALDHGGNNVPPPPPQPKKDKPKGKTSIFSRNKSSAKNKKKNPVKIVGLDESDDDELDENGEAVNKLHRGGKNSDDSKLKEDLDDLDRTFSSLGLVGKQMWKDDDYSEENTRNFASSDRWNKNNTDGRPDNEFLNSSYANHTRFPRGAGHGVHNGSVVALQRGGGHHGHGRAQPLKFSWQDEQAARQQDKDTEDWKYKKTVIDGFDPDKFRKVNKQPGGPTPAAAAAVHSRPKPSSMFAPPPPKTAATFNSFSNNNNDDDGGGAFMDVPGAAVPTYDRTEQQLLQTLEQELGVL